MLVRRGPRVRARCARAGEPVVALDPAEEPADQDRDQPVRDPADQDDADDRREAGQDLGRLLAERQGPGPEPGTAPRGAAASAPSGRPLRRPGRPAPRARATWCIRARSRRTSRTASSVMKYADHGEHQARRWSCPRTAASRRRRACPRSTCQSVPAVSQGLAWRIPPTDWARPWTLAREKLLQSPVRHGLAEAEAEGVHERREPGQVEPRPGDRRRLVEPEHVGHGEGQQRVEPVEGRHADEDACRHARGQARRLLVQVQDGGRPLAETAPGEDHRGGERLRTPRGARPAPRRS